jgi:hypothetical protein
VLLWLRPRRVAEARGLPYDSRADRALAGHFVKRSADLTRGRYIPHAILASSCHSRTISGPKGSTVTFPIAYAFDRQRIVVADEESVTTTRIIATLRDDGHCVAHEPAGLSAPDSLAVAQCQLMITTMRVEGVVRMDLLKELRDRLPALTVLYLSNGASPTVDPAPPDGLPTLRASCTTPELQAEVRRLLPQLRAGTVLARHSGETAPVIDGLAPVARQGSGLGCGQ